MRIYCALRFFWIKVKQRLAGIAGRCFMRTFQSLFSVLFISF